MDILDQPERASPQPSFGPYPICARDMVDDGASTDKHHMVPKSKGGAATTRIHKICHSFIHSKWTEKELAHEFCDPESILADAEAQVFISWVGKKHTQYYDKSVRHSRKGKKR